MADPRVRRNVQKMIDQGAPENDIDGYLASEGLTPEQFKTSISKPSGVGAIDEFVQGMTLQGADEALGVLGSGAQERYRSGLKQYEQEHPYRAEAANIAGSFATPMGAAGQLAKRGLPLIERAVDAIRTGALAGAGAGFLGGEGGMENRSQGAIIGGALGGVGGAGMAGLSNVAQKALRYRGDKGVRKVAQSLERDEVKPEALAQKYARGQQISPKPETVADIAGENTKSLAGVAAGVPGRARNQAQNFMVTRQQGDLSSPTAAGSAAGRVGDDAANALAGGDKRSVFQTAEELTAGQKAASAPAYKKAYAHPMIWTEDLEELSRRPSIRKAWKEAQANAAEEDRALPEFDDLFGNKQRVPDMQAWDDVKRGLDDLIAKDTDDLTGKMGPDARRWSNTKNELLAQLDAMNPDYASARQAFGGPAQSKNALRMGRNILKEDAEFTERDIAKLSPSDKEYFALGVVQAVKDAAEGTANTGNVARMITGSPKLRKRLGAAIPNANDFANFVFNLEREQAMLRTFNKTRGSQTAEKLTAMQEGGVDIAKVGAHALMGNKITMVGHIVNMLGRKGMDEKTANSIGDLLLNADPRMVEDALAQVAKFNKAQALSKGTSRSLTVGAGAAGGGQAEDAKQSALNQLERFGFR